jgi:predicted transcriptional regulator
VEALLRLGRGSVAEVRAALTDPPSYSAVRTMLGVLERKGYVGHTEEGRRYIYRPVRGREGASTSALTHLVRTFFGGSRERAMVALLDLSEEPLSEAELERLRRLIESSEGGRKE